MRIRKRKRERISRESSFQVCERGRFEGFSERKNTNNAIDLPLTACRVLLKTKNAKKWKRR